MQLFAALALLPLLALASPVEKRSGASITQAIGYINGNITTLNNTVTGYNKKNDAITAFEIQTQSSAVQKAVDNAASVANASAPLSEQESGNVAVAVLNLQPRISSLLNNLVSKKPYFQTAIFGFSADPLVKNSLTDQKTSADKFGAALTPKLTKDYQSAAPTIIKQIDAAFNKAIKAFST